jgi:hypothetical protein
VRGLAASAVSVFLSAYFRASRLRCDGAFLVTALRRDAGAFEA